VLQVILCGQDVGDAKGIPRANLGLCEGSFRLGAQCGESTIGGLESIERSMVKGALGGQRDLVQRQNGVSKEACPPVVVLLELGERHIPILKPWKENAPGRASKGSYRDLPSRWEVSTPPLRGSG
jgi:hypothetical protein